MTKQKRKVKEITDKQFSEWKDSDVTQRLFEMFQIELEASRINLVERRGTIQELGEAALVNLTQADVFEALVNMDENYLNTPLYMEVD